MGRRKVVTVQPGQGTPAVVDPNPARTAADAAEANVIKGATGDAAELSAVTGVSAGDAAAAKTIVEQDHADQVQDNAQAQITQHEAAEEAANIAFEDMVSDMEVINRIMTDHSVNEVYENSKQEYFLNLNLAINSEGGNKNRVRTHTALTE